MKHGFISPRLLQRLAPIVIRLIERLFRVGKYEPNRNQWIRMALGILRNLDCLVECRGEVEWTSATSGTGPSAGLIRNPEPQAIESLVFNRHATQSIKLYEGAVFVAVIAPLSTFLMPLGGKGVIKAAPYDSVNVTVDVRTLRRCECNNPRVYSETSLTPIGIEFL